MPVECQQKRVGHLGALPSPLVNDKYAGPPLRGAAEARRSSVYGRGFPHVELQGSAAVVVNGYGTPLKPNSDARTSLTLILRSRQPGR